MLERDLGFRDAAALTPRLLALRGAEAAQEVVEVGVAVVVPMKLTALPAQEAVVVEQRALGLEGE